MSDIETDKNTTNSNPPLIESPEVQEEIRQIELWKEFIDKIDPYSTPFRDLDTTEDKEIQEVSISKEEKARLFFAPEYNPTPTEIEEREKHIAESGYEIQMIDEPTEENNLVLQKLKEREERKR
ncbi:MAG: hypothetical protein XD93_0290, partial [candidate division WS6 bacterium 34_10]